ncbi:hypothetical protein FH972_019267 [Carpinus fangiana]|uniref:NADP-dependent oxidoreductase domain-containing protein n=1 Tax=Carpinus fangiana TaxID=176857 RepID=A0A5N6RT50_9ROSI|nr:hypothetical protein FH972_019267 [Carpinus fangiana]
MVGVAGCLAKEEHERKTPAKVTKQEEEDEIPLFYSDLMPLLLEYIDLYLIHWPFTVKPGKGGRPFAEEDLMPMDFKSVWAAMEECQRLGLAKFIGVSNFSCKKLQNLISSSTIPPAVNQVEMSPIWQQKKLRDFCKANGIVVTAFSPLGAKGGAPAMLWRMKFSWRLQKQGGRLLLSYNKERLKENLQIFDWELSEDDCKKISETKQHGMMLKEEFISARGPYNSIEELWDGEL